MSNDKNMRKALIIDDSFLIRRLHKTNLGNLGFSTFEAENGQDGLDKIQELGVDSLSLIVVDMVMPVMNGIEFIVSFNKNYPDSSVPVLVCSSKSDITLIKKLIAVGISGYILKPVNSNMFAKKVKEIFPDIE